MLKTIVKRSRIRQIFKDSNKRMPRGFFDQVETVAHAAARNPKLEDKEDINHPKLVKWNAWIRLGMSKNLMPKINGVVISLVNKEIEQIDRKKISSNFGVVRSYISSKDISRVLAAKKYPSEPMMKAANRIGVVKYYE